MIFIKRRNKICFSKTPFQKFTEISILNNNDEEIITLIKIFENKKSAKNICK